MKTLTNLFVTILLVWVATQFAYYDLGYKYTSDEDYYIDLPVPEDIVIPIDTTMISKPDTTPYKGNWVDTQ